MNILIVNYRYFVSGGPERYLFNAKKLFENHGHKVIPFSVRNIRNQQSEYSKYFLSPIGDGTECYFSDIHKTPKSLIKMFDRSFYSFEASVKLNKLLQSNSVDIAYLLHFKRWMSPSIINVLRKRNIPVVVRLSDFSYICPNGLCLRDNKTCEYCLGGNLFNSVRYKCLQKSKIISGINYLSDFCNRLLDTYSNVTAFVSPSRFLLNKMINNGFSSDRLFHIPTFVNNNLCCNYNSDNNYILYFGRITPEKGLNTLIDAFGLMQKKYRNNHSKLLIVGSGSKSYLETLGNLILYKKINNVKFIGEQNFEDLTKTISRAAFVVVPSICYDNMPNTILESYACGKPVVASNIGSLPEIVFDGSTGRLFPPANVNSLADILEWMLNHTDQVRLMGKAAHYFAATELSPERHLERLQVLFNTLMADKLKIKH